MLKLLQNFICKQKWLQTKYCIDKVSLKGGPFCLLLDSKQSSFAVSFILYRFAQMSLNASFEMIGRCENIYLKILLHNHNTVKERTERLSSISHWMKDGKFLTYVQEVSFFRGVQGNKFSLCSRWQWIYTRPCASGLPGTTRSLPWPSALRSSWLNSLITWTRVNGFLYFN